MSGARTGVRAWLRTYVLALGATTAVTVGGLVGVNYVYDQKLDKIERIDVTVDENTDPGEPANFLLIGSDTRAFVTTPEQEEAFGDEADAGGQRSDTIMVVHVDPEERTGLLVSFPRDLLVEIPGLGETKINAAYNQGGAQSVIDTIQSNFNIPIHHYLEVDFASFEGIVNAVGGVPIYFPAPARDEVTGLDVAYFGATYPGCFELDGRQALAYVRSRNYEQQEGDVFKKDETADIGRITRQQDFMRRLAAEAVATSLRNPLAANRIADEALSELKADEGLSKTDINKLIQAFRRIDPNDRESLVMVTFPWSPADNGADLVPDMGAAEPLLAQLRTLEATPVPADGPAPSEILVEVLNGSGVDGAAGDTASVLLEQGFQGGATGNADPLEQTEVRYRPGSEDKAEVVRAVLTGGVGVLVADDAIVQADVQLVLGDDFEGITPPAGAVPAETSAAPETAPTPETGTEESTPPEQQDEEPAPSAAC
jgi:polyisoprenyl-teichoic acid--peptidoglycan teichoic acid transferase